MSTASHNWSKVLMGEWSHPPCEGWRGNVAGGNGFSQFAETDGVGGWGTIISGGHRGAPHCPFAPTPPASSWRTRDAETLIVLLCVFAAALLWRGGGVATAAFDYYFGPFFPGMDPR